MISISDSPPGADLTQLAQINAASGIASQISVDIIAEVGIFDSTSSVNDTTKSFSSYKQKLTAKVNQNLKNVSFAKRANDETHF